MEWEKWETEWCQTCWPQWTESVRSSWISTTASDHSTLRSQLLGRVQLIVTLPTKISHGSTNARQRRRRRQWRPAFSRMCSPSSCPEWWRIGSATTNVFPASAPPFTTPKSLSLYRNLPMILSIRQFIFSKVTQHSNIHFSVGIHTQTKNSKSCLFSVCDSIEFTEFWILLNFIEFTHSWSSFTWFVLVVTDELGMDTATNSA